ncbi:MAG TPA: P1 family peptidase [Oscillatoriaceae cyanobacterium]
MLRLALSAFLLLSLAVPAAAREQRAHLRDWGVELGQYPTGKWNAITDVRGVRVGQVTLNEGSGRLDPGQGPVRTGVTAIIPRDDIWHHKCFAGRFVLNGNGEVTGLDWLHEAGWLETPIILTDTLSVGRAMDGVVDWMEDRYPLMGRGDDVVLPIVGECDDEFLNDQRGRHVHPEDVVRALDAARTGPVAEGCVGAGTGMNAYRFKAGIGTASRVLPAKDGGYTVGVLVNANMGFREDLRMAGVPIGREIPDLMPKVGTPDGSILMIVATDAPLLPDQLDRLAKRAALGLARTGSTAANSSGDFAVAFSTAADLPHDPKTLTQTVTMVHTQDITPLFEATVEATEEAIYNALTMATTTVGRDGNTTYAIPLDRLKTLLTQAGRIPAKSQVLQPAH